ncbi:MAG: recombinase family protein [Phenylobacterium sp.]|uniref:recombinase family protein n=1 Tax=Phenylobacterium sp. TaxID=1871053 RepID=UPI00391D1810
MAIEEGYDDGGYSGGHLDRPALKRLLADIEAGRIDIVVVYKIDRLTRSLADFAKLVEVFDRNGVSFVSVTQQFNTTTSMGRLTLNILLSFAQFEREVTGERIRDKIAASKAKGMWMGGMPPLGYDVVDRKLVVNEREAALVRDIFRRYAEHGSAARLVRELAVEGHTTKAWVTQGGRQRRGRPIDQQYIFAMLRNRIYLGEIRNHGTWYPGQHEAIVPQDLWDAAHAFIARRKQAPREHRAKHPALLAGLLFAPDGQRMLHTFVKKKSGRTYRYYVPYLHKRRNAGASLAPDAPDVGHLPAAEIENAVLTQIHAALSAPEVLIGTWRACQRHPAGAALDEAQVVVAMRRIGDVWAQLFPAEQQRIARLLIERVQLHDHGLDILWREDGWLGLEPEIGAHPLGRSAKPSCQTTGMGQ